MKIGIIGLGTVGQGVAALLERHRDLYAARAGQHLHITAALVRNTARARELTPHAALITSDEDLFFAQHTDLIVEVAGGVPVARALVTRAIDEGRDVITANKALLADSGPQLFALAEKRRRRIFFEAAVAGGVPVIKLITDSLASNSLSDFTGILNGTCNFILTAMQQGGDYADALRKAQHLGYAEADPTLDVSGRDSLEKLAILAALAFGGPADPDAVQHAPITQLTRSDLERARQQGGVLKLLACARRTDTAIELWNGPAFLPDHSPLARVAGASMALRARGDAVPDIFISGEGAGRFPTASAVVADILEAARLWSLRPAAPARLNHWPVAAPPLRIAPWSGPFLRSERDTPIAQFTE
ncbi:MAG: homoserine dehydrogenase [Planctomycetota bacterium]|nr:homoserine dehydrogenase [Planctomycetota bacterium]